MKNKAELKPTADQTFEIEGGGAEYHFQKILLQSRKWQAGGEVERACEARFRAVQRIQELLPEDEEVILEFSHPNSRAALELIQASAVDHFLIGEFELSAALLELLLEVDPEDHLEGINLLAFNYVELEDYDSFNDLLCDLSEKDAAREILLLWSGFRRTGQLPEEPLKRLKSRFAPWFAEFAALDHAVDDHFLKEIASEHPAPAVRARELWLQTEPLWTLHPDFVEALRQHA